MSYYDFEGKKDCLNLMTKYWVSLIVNAPLNWLFLWKWNTVTVLYWVSYYQRYITRISTFHLGKINNYSLVHTNTLKLHHADMVLWKIWKTLQKCFLWNSSSYSSAHQTSPILNWLEIPIISDSIILTSCQI